MPDFKDRYGLIESLEFNDKFRDAVCSECPTWAYIKDPDDFPCDFDFTSNKCYRKYKVESLFYELDKFQRNIQESFEG